MTRTFAFTISVLVLGTALPALAEPTCTDQPKSAWMDEQAFKEKAMKEQGITKISTFQVTEGNCYEIYGYKGDKKVEIYFDPVTGAVVESEEDED